jgi:hypothetical protein
MAMWSAGVGAAAATALMCFSPPREAGALLQLAVAAVPLGYALHYAERCWLVRAGSGTRGFAQFVSAVLASVAVGLTLSRWWLLPAAGSLGVMAVAALGMLAFGGLIQIYSQDRGVRVRQRRLAMIFASLAGAMLVFPAGARQWARREALLADPPPARLDLGWLPLRAPASARRVGLLGLSPSGATASRLPLLVRVDYFSEKPELDPGSQDARSRFFAGDLHRSFRRVRGRYDVLYQAPAVARERPALLSLEWFSLLVERAGNGAAVFVDVPLDGFNRESLAVVAGTFDRASGGAAQWRLAYPQGRAVLRLGVEVRRDELPPGLFDLDWTPANALLLGGPRPKTHSLGRDRLSAPLRQGAATGNSLLDWLQSCQRATRSTAP